ncbi:MAG TPA: sigma-70 family RNA polymerase sigma factor [Clostridiales bacterium]|nr:sigma-70 family RNA polymerase sigma factor [Clostridiales bacterium]
MQLEKNLKDSRYKEDNHFKEIESLIEEYGNDVLRTAYMYVKNKDVAEDVFQDVFIKISKNLKTFKGKSNIKTWMIRITINTSKDYLKSAWNRRVFPISEYRENTLAAENDFLEIEKKEEEKTVRDAVTSLKDKHKDLILCVYFMDMTIKEAALCLNIKEGTAKSRLSRAKEKLREELEGRL